MRLARYASELNYLPVRRERLSGLGIHGGILPPPGAFSEHGGNKLLNLKRGSFKDMLRRDAFPSVTPGCHMNKDLISDRRKEETPDESLRTQPVHFLQLHLRLRQTRKMLRMCRPPPALR
jgi:hypothetical protein